MNILNKFFRKKPLTTTHYQENKSIENSPSLLNDVKSYLHKKIKQAKTITLDSNGGSFLFRGQDSEDFPRKASFWSQAEKAATNHANPFLLCATISIDSNFAAINGFVDCLIGKFCSHEELADYAGACEFLRKLSNEGFFEEFTNISGIIDTSASGDYGHEKIFLFTSSQLNLKEIRCIA